jgi:hypothetical protein
MSFARDLLFVGSFLSSHSHLEELIALYDPLLHRSLARQVGFDPHVMGQALLGNVLCSLGFLDQALARSRAAIDEARALAHAPSQVGSLTNGSTVFSLMAMTQRWMRPQSS